MRTRIPALLAALTLLLLAGCTQEEAAVASLPPVQIAEQPAASSGGACTRWDYGLISEKTGVTFTVAAAVQVGATATCVVQTEAGEWPYLALSVVKKTKADADDFAGSMAPAKSTRTKGLGRAGYRLQSKATGGHGPTIEIGWLGAGKQLQTLRFTFAKGAPAADVKKMQAGLLSLAKALESAED